MRNRSTRTKSYRYFAVSITITVVALIVAVLHAFKLPKDHPLLLDGTVVGILVVAALPWVIDRIEVLKGPGFEIRQRLDNQDEKIAEQQERLNRIFLLSMEDDMFDTLRNLTEGEFVHDANYQPILEQMKHLHNLGYLAKSPDEMREQDGDDIGHGLIVTETGKDFVRERKKMEAQKREVKKEQ